MTPTNKLRFIERKHFEVIEGSALGSTAKVYSLKILQQWWEEDDGDYEGLGEWRDVPFEEQA